MKKNLAEVLLFVLWYFFAGISILTAVLTTLVIFGDQSVTRELANVLLALSFATALVFETLRRRRGTHDVTAYLIFPLTLLTVLLGSLFLKMPSFGLFFVGGLAVAFWIILSALVSKPDGISPTGYISPRVEQIDPIVERELGRAATQFTHA